MKTMVLKPLEVLQKGLGVLIDEESCWAVLAACKAWEEGNTDGGDGDSDIEGDDLVEANLTYCIVRYFKQHESSRDRPDIWMIQMHANSGQFWPHLDIRCGWRGLRD